MAMIGWDAYLCTSDGKPMSVVLDLDAYDEAPDPARPIVYRVQITLRTPDANGFPGDAESEALNRMEDTVLTDAALTRVGLRYVGRVTGGGARDLFFYGAPARPVDQLVDDIRAALPEHEVDFTPFEDAAWRFYLEQLYPNPDERQCMNNHRVLANLQQHGDDMTTPREIDHYLYFATPEERDAARAVAEADGFRATDTESEPDRDSPYGLILSRTDSVDVFALDRLVLALAHLAQEHHGEYDGWETTVVPAQ